MIFIKIEHFSVYSLFYEAGEKYLCLVKGIQLRKAEGLFENCAACLMFRQKRIIRPSFGTRKNKIVPVDAVIQQL